MEVNESKLETNSSEKLIYNLLNFVGDNFFYKHSEDCISNLGIVRDFERKENECISIPAVSMLKQCLSVDERILFYGFYKAKTCKNERIDLFSMLCDLYGKNKLNKYVTEFKQEKHQLQKLGFVELIKDEINRPKVKVTDKGFEMLLCHPANQTNSIGR